MTDEMITRLAARSHALSLVHLYSIKMPSGQMLRFTSDSETPISFGGKSYQVLPVEAAGFSWNDRRAPTRPSLSLANKNGLFTSQLDDPDLIGQQVVRIVTFAEECDAPIGQGGGSSFAPECWMINRLTRLDAEEAVFELIPEADLEQKSLPSRVMLRDLCQHRYRSWDSKLKRFDYANATCPYVGSKIFDEHGNSVTDASQDRCSLSLDSGCKKRFEGVLPYLGFPGIGGY